MHVGAGHTAVTGHRSSSSSSPILCISMTSWLSTATTTAVTVGRDATERVDVRGGPQGEDGLVGRIVDRAAVSNLALAAPTRRGVITTSSLSSPSAVSGAPMRRLTHGDLVLIQRHNTSANTAPVHKQTNKLRHET